MSYVLKVLDEVSATMRRHFLEPGEHVVGSARTCDVLLDAPGVSRRHARLEVLADGGLVVTDLGSRNGTFVNNRKIERKAVTDYAVIAFGSSQTVVHADEKGMGQIALASALAMSAAPPDSADGGDETSTRGLSLAEGLAAELRALVTRAGSLDDPALALCHLLRTSLPVESVELRRTAGGQEVIAAASGKAAADAEEIRFEAEGWALVLSSRNGPVLRRLRPFCELALAWLATLGDRRGASPPPDAVAAPPPGEAALPPPGVVSPEMQALYRRCRKIARGEIPLLVLGESGSGKEVLARWIHERSRRSGGPFLAVNCAALPHELLEAELFGIERGVATGVEARPGLLEQASGGTLLLDEIGDMPLDLQAKVLRVLENTQVLRVGGRQPVRVDVRFVAATHQDLERAMEEKRFRRDLFHRLAAFVVRLPPLRERPEDVALLTGHFFHRELARRGVASPGVTRRALAALIAWEWPGNVRQLQNEIARAVLLIEPGEALDVHHLSPAVAGAAASGGLPLSLSEAVARAERRAFRTAHAVAAGDVARAIELLGVSRTTYYRKLKELSLEQDAEEDPDE